MADTDRDRRLDRIFKSIERGRSLLQGAGAVALVCLALASAGRNLFAGRLVERGDLCFAQSVVVEADVIQAAIEPMRHMESTPAHGAGMPDLAAINAPFL